MYTYILVCLTQYPRCQLYYIIDRIPQANSLLLIYNVLLFLGGARCFLILVLWYCVAMVRISYLMIFCGTLHGDRISNQKGLLLQ